MVHLVDLAVQQEVIKQLSRQGFWVYGIQGDFKSSIRYFDATIRSYMGIKQTLHFPNFGISHEFTGKFWVK